MRKRSGHVYIYLFGFYVTFNTVQVIPQPDSFIGRGNQYKQLVKVLYCESQRWEAKVLALCHRGPWACFECQPDTLKDFCESDH